MKKFLLALGVVAALSLLFVGCDKPTDEPAGGGGTTAEWDGVVDLTGKTVKNADAFAAAYGGFVIALGQDVDLSKFSKLQVGVKLFGADGTEIAANWGLGQYMLLADPAGSWGGDNQIALQYNLGKEDMDLSSKTATAKALVVQNSTADVKYIEVTSIKFVK